MATAAPQATGGGHAGCILAHRQPGASGVVGRGRADNCQPDAQFLSSHVGKWWSCQT